MKKNLLILFVIGLGMGVAYYPVLGLETVFLHFVTLAGYLLGLWLLGDK